MQDEYSIDKEASRCNCAPHCRAGKGFDRFPAVIDLHGYVNTSVAAATASLSRDFFLLFLRYVQ